MFQDGNAVLTVVIKEWPIIGLVNNLKKPFVIRNIELFTPCLD